MRQPLNTTDAVTRRRVAENRLRRRAARLGLRVIKVQGGGYYVVPASDGGRTFRQIDAFIRGEEQKQTGAKASR